LTLGGGQTSSSDSINTCYLVLEGDRKKAGIILRKDNEGSLSRDCHSMLKEAYLESAQKNQ
jgi:hypothetical protein